MNFSLNFKSCQCNYLAINICQDTSIHVKLLLMQKEFEFINNIRQKFSLDKIGDDCAVLRKNKTHDMLITADLLVEEIDFKRSWMIPKLLGQKALAVSLSDIAAMGGTPLYSMLSIGIPQAIWDTEFVDEFYIGYFELANEFNVELIGGDVSRTPDKIVIDSTVIGESKCNKAVLRSGAKVGDLIYVTGELGGASGGLRLLENGSIYGDKNELWQDELLSKQLNPLPRIAAGKDLAKISTSMIDISDGLSSDLNHICEASGIGAKIFAEKIPVHRMITNLATNSFEQLDFALNGGEDFELLFTASPKKYFNNQNPHFFCIGEITANVGIIELINNQESTILQPKGYQHF